MNKIIWISAAVLSVAACAKNEVIPVNSGENQEITFNVAPKTKADPQLQPGEFSTGNVFASWAYYLPSGMNWKQNSGDAKEYISGATIVNNANTEGKWKCGSKSYYWPKNGSLTFFAYSLNRDKLAFNDVVHGAQTPSFVDCHQSTGISAHLDLKIDPNVDFLVADPAYDKVLNESNYGATGVPTLFRHKLSWIVVKVKAGNYKNKSFELQSITFKIISSAAWYRQLADESNPSGFNPTSGSARNDVSYTTKVQLVPTDKLTDVAVNSSDHRYYIPQTFADDSTIEVVYTITTTVGSDTVTENVKKTIQLNTLFQTVTDPATSKVSGGWEMGKKYTINLTFTLDEILWDPAVQDWDVEGTTVDKTVA